MGQRFRLQELLETILGSRNVYFQPPNNFRMEYPCIRYQQDYQDNDYADNFPYRSEKRYLVTVIGLDPDSPVPDMIAALPKCRFSRFYTADDLNHHVYNLYF